MGCNKSKEIKEEMKTEKNLSTNKTSSPNVLNNNNPNSQTPLNKTEIKTL